MRKRNIYQGSGSCYALNEGIYVPDRGVNLSTALGISYLILRDLRRGWTYDKQCRIIPMTPELARSRLNYLYPLALKHYGREEAEKVRKLIDIIYRNNLSFPIEFVSFIKQYPVFEKTMRDVREKQKVYVGGLVY
ncbi:MAG: hypothetical protein QXX12_00730 [Nanopusillaceae archaeon]